MITVTNQVQRESCQLTQFNPIATVLLLIISYCNDGTMTKHHTGTAWTGINGWLLTINQQLENMHSLQHNNQFVDLNSILIIHACMEDGDMIQQW